MSALIFIIFSELWLAAGTLVSRVLVLGDLDGYIVERGSEFYFFQF
jgi:hypothetical protein